MGVAFPPPGLAGEHGPLMVAGFFGALIALERAVGLGRAWTYLAPAFMALGGLLLAAGLGGYGYALLVLGALLYLGVAGYIYRLQPADFTAAMALGAALLLAGDLAYGLAARSWAALLWAGYLVLIVAGERLELARFVPKPPGAARRFALAEGVTLLGLVFFPLAPAVFGRVGGLGFLALALWLLRHDVAWVNLKRGGVHRFMGAALLTGYVWLLLGGLLLLGYGLPAGGLLYDAILHAVYLGFVFAMVFGHAPVIFPAVLRLPIRFHPLAYLPLWGLHLGLLLRLAGDLLARPGWRQAGGVLDAAMIVLYFLITAGVSLGGRLLGRSPEPPPG